MRPYLPVLSRTPNFIMYSFLVFKWWRLTLKKSKPTEGQIVKMCKPNVTYGPWAFCSLTPFVLCSWKQRPENESRLSTVVAKLVSVKNIGCEPTLPEFECCVPHLLAVRPWAHCWASLGLRLLVFKIRIRTSVMIQQLRLHASSAGGAGSIPGQVTKILRSYMQSGQKRKSE